MSTTTALLFSKEPVKSTDWGCSYFVYC